VRSLVRSRLATRLSLRPVTSSAMKRRSSSVSPGPPALTSTNRHVHRSALARRILTSPDFDIHNGGSGTDYAYRSSFGQPPIGRCPATVNWPQAARSMVVMIVH
jgi:hypothetical protein